MSLLTSDNQAHFFGLDLRAVWQDAASVGRAMAARAPLVWLVPTQRVRLLGADGSQTGWVSRADVLRRLSDAKGGAASAAHVAIEMQQDHVLLHRFQLPATSANQAEAAARMEALRLSPFAPHETVWGFALQEAPGAASVTVHLALCARTHVDSCLAARQGVVGKARPEVWAFAGELPLVLKGFGEESRRRQARTGFAWALFWLLLALGWLAAMALTPSLQLRETALDAQAQYAAKGQAASNALGQREALLRSNRMLKEVDDALAQRSDPKLALELLTKALDDGVFLQRLDVKGRTVSIAGQAANATALVQTLSGQPGFEDVKAMAAATRQPNGTERFSIDFTLKPPPVPSATTPEASGVPAVAATTPVSTQGAKP